MLSSSVPELLIVTDRHGRDLPGRGPVMIRLFTKRVIVQLLAVKLSPYLIDSWKFHRCNNNDDQLKSPAIAQQQLLPCRIAGKNGGTGWLAVVWSGSLPSPRSLPSDTSHIMLLWPQWAFMALRVLHTAVIEQ